MKRTWLSHNAALFLRPLFLSLSLPFHDAQKIHCSSAEWVRGMELKLCYDHLCGRGGFLHQERAQTRWEQSHTLNEGKKHSKCHKKQNSAKKNRNNKERDGESKIAWTWLKFEINCTFRNRTTICSWNSCSLLFRLLWKALTSRCMRIYAHILSTVCVNVSAERCVFIYISAALILDTIITITMFSYYITDPFQRLMTSFHSYYQM